MCGIVGYTGSDIAKNILVTGLKRMEYRGYDSSGVALEVGEGAAAHLDVIRRVGKVAGLESELSNIDSDATCGIGHTRWATHGKPSHPHTSCDGRIAIVHNGIIENFAELREELEGRGHHFKSETDTEVFAHLIEEAYAETHDLMASVREACTHVVGAYGLAAVCADEPGVIAVARKDSPIVVGVGETGSYVASDVIALIDATRDVVVLEDGQFAKLTPAGVEYTDEAGNVIEPKVTHIDWDLDMAEKGGYPDFMLKEIHEQPRAIREATAARIQGGQVVLRDLNMTDQQIRDINKIFIVACGSSYHVGMVGKYNLERMLRRSVEVCLASEFRYSDPIVGKGDLVIVISQSGETLDTMAALREAKRRGAHILSIVNVVGSSIARESHTVLYTWAGPEIAVATTKAYSTQMAVLNLLGLYFSQVMGTLDHEVYSAMVRGIEKLPEQMERILEQAEHIHDIAKRCAGREDVFFIGRNLDYALSLEGSLKLKEISYIHSEAYASGELKHGTISLIEDGTLVIALGTYTPLFDKAMSNVVEVQARGAQVLALTTESHAGEMGKRVPMLMTIPDTEEMLLPQLGVVPLQLLSYYIALERGCDIDKPRNLAKSVTVE